NRVLETIYLKAIFHNAIENEALTLADFNNHKLWQANIGKSQRTIDRQKWSHLHFANEAMGDSFKKHFASDTRLGNTASGSGAAVSLLEGGVGGCNTTHYVVQGILDGLMQRGITSPSIHITYRGFE